MKFCPRIKLDASTSAFFRMMHPAIEIHSRHSYFAFWLGSSESHFKDVIKVEHAVDALRAIPGENLETGIVESNMHISQCESLRMLILEGLFLVMYHLTSHVFFSSCLCSTSWMMEFCGILSPVCQESCDALVWRCKAFATSTSDWNIDSSTHRLALDHFGQSCKAWDLELQVKQRNQRSDASDASRGASHLGRDGLGCLARSWANPGFQRYEEFYVTRGIEELWATGFFHSITLHKLICYAFYFSASDWLVVKVGAFWF